MTIRILVVDDHAVFREGLVALLSKRSDLEVIAQSGSGEEALPLAINLKPDVILLDMNMAGGNGIDTARKLVECVPDSKIVVLTAYDYVQYVREMVRTGVRGYLLKSSTSDQIVNAVRKIAAGEPVLDERLAKQAFELLGGSGGARGRHLTRREVETLTLIATGMPNAEIAKSLFVSQKTVETHITSLLGKLQVSNRTEAVRVAIDKGLIPGDRVR